MIYIGPCTIDCLEKCNVPLERRLAVVPRPRHAWTDVVVCPNDGCGLAFLVLQPSAGHCTMTITLHPDVDKSRAPGMWWAARSGGKVNAIWSCPKCGAAATLKPHTIKADGTVEPSVICPKDCGFHDWVVLDEVQPEVVNSDSR